MMLVFLYTCYYDAPEGMKNDETAALHAEVYALGRKYDIPPLAELARVHFTQYPTIMKCKFDDKKIGYLACLKAASIVYNKTPDTDRALRDVLIAIVKKNNMADYLDDSESDKIFDEAPGTGKHCVSFASTATWDRC